jgi:hypothetical protein
MIETPILPLTGGCQCGAVRYGIAALPVRVYICHCLECRKQSASAFGISVWVRREDFTLLSGAPHFWSRPTDSGRVLNCAFCPECGSRVWHEYAGGNSEFLTIKGGSLDEPVDLNAVPHVWVKRKLPGVIIPDSVRQFQENPA